MNDAENHPRPDCPAAVDEPRGFAAPPSLTENEEKKDPGRVGGGESSRRKEQWGVEEGRAPKLTILSCMTDVREDLVEC